jgi:translation initiation factor IF-3
VRIGDHDFETKLRRAEGFLSHGHKVKLTLQFRGRENEHRDLGFVRVNLARTELAGIATADSEPRLVGRQVALILSPLPEGKRVLKFNHADHEYDDRDDSEVEENDDEEAEVAGES